MKPTATTPPLVSPIGAIEPGFVSITPRGRGFVGSIDVRYINGRMWELLSEFVYCSVLLNTCLHLPVGTRSNFASIPRALWSFVTPTDPHIAAAALIHDELYHNVAYRITREQADKVLIEGMKILGASATQRAITYRFIRWFGPTKPSPDGGGWYPRPAEPAR
jgi:hypothetical protein